MKAMRLVLALALVFAVAGVAPSQEKRKRRLLVIGQSKGYQHESISTAMVTLYNLGRRSGTWDTYFRTDCTAITKKPLKYGARNLDDFDAVVFFTDGDLDMDASQKADLLSFVRDDGKGFIGVHSAAITFLSCAGAAAARARISTRARAWRIPVMAGSRRAGRPGSTA